MNLQGIILNEKLIPQSYILDDSIHITFLKWQNFKNADQISGWPRLVMGSGVGGKWVRLQKGNRRDPCGNVTGRYLDYGDEYTNFHM